LHHFGPFSWRPANIPPNPEEQVESINKSDADISAEFSHRVYYCHGEFLAYSCEAPIRPLLRTGGDRVLRDDVFKICAGGGKCWNRMPKGR
jgi:hypothetical protein